jgi:hypothetical protein
MGALLILSEQSDAFHDLLTLQRRETAVRRQQEHRTRQAFGFRAIAGIPVGTPRFGRVEIDQTCSYSVAPQLGDAADGGFLARRTHG